MILVGDKPVAVPENAELEIVHPQDPVTAISEFAQLPNQYLVHRSTLSLSHYPSLRSRRYHICRSKKLRPAARMMAQTAVRASVAFTGRSPKGGSSRWRSSHLAA